MFPCRFIQIAHIRKGLIVEKPHASESPGEVFPLGRVGIDTVFIGSSNHRPPVPRGRIGGRSPWDSMYFLIASILVPPVEIRRKGQDQNASLYNLGLMEGYSFFINLEEAGL